ncbi:MAG TPA: TRAP transporter substrate-binding protein [Burkholderiales bacterium]
MSSRRRFLRRAAATGGAGLAFPALVAAQGTVVQRWQSAWPERHPCHEHALDLARRVNDMAGGDLRIDLLPLGEVVPAFGLLEAVASGRLDGAHGALLYQYPRHPAFALWAAGPAFGMDANMLLAWHHYGGGRALLAKVYAELGADVVSLLYGPRPSEPLGWFQRRISRPADLRRLRFRSEGPPVELFERLGARVNPLPEGEVAAALESGLLDGAELDGAARDRALGVADAAKVCMLGSFHEAAAQFEVLLHKPKLEALPAKLKAIIENAVAAASADLSWRVIERDSAAYQALRARGGVAFHRTPEAVLRAQLEAHDDAVAARRRSARLIAEIEASQKAFAARAVRWQLDHEADRRLAYRHYFAPRPAGTRRKR